MTELKYRYIFSSHTSIVGYLIFIKINTEYAFGILPWLGNRTIGVNLVKNVSGFDIPFAPLGLAVGWITVCSIHLSPL